MRAVRSCEHVRMLTYADVCLTCRTGYEREEDLKEGRYWQSVRYSVHSSVIFKVAKGVLYVLISKCSQQACTRFDKRVDASIFTLSGDVA
jgi:hypothetical protein